MDSFFPSLFLGALRESCQHIQTKSGLMAEPRRLSGGEDERRLGNKSIFTTIVTWDYISLYEPTQATKQ